jgi:hypothetical protein
VVSWWTETVFERIYSFLITGIAGYANNVYAFVTVSP